MTTVLRQIRENEKTAMLIAEQNIAALAIAGHGYVLQNGKVVASGTTPVSVEPASASARTVPFSAGTTSRDRADVNRQRDSAVWAPLFQQPAK